MHEVTIEDEFSAARALRGYRGKCENMHGHNWKVDVYVRGEHLDQFGMLVDFKELKAATRRVMKYLDHQNLNELKGWRVGDSIDVRDLRSGLLTPSFRDPRP